MSRATGARESGGVPTGVVTFLFTDIEGSTELWEKAPQDMGSALARHDQILRSTIDAHGGYVFATGGDGFAVAFSSATSAFTAAVDGQRRLRAEVWPEHASLRVRMGLHSGEATERDADYFGPVVNQAARVMSVAHGGQTVITATTEGLLGDGELDGVELSDAGEHRLKGLQAPVRLLCVVIDGDDDHPPLRSLERPPSNLPRSRTPFFGRGDELARLADLCIPGSIVTIIGPGGAGKTRLALAHAGSTERANGAWFVDLSDVQTDQAVPPAVATALGLARGDRDASGVAGRLAHWNAIMVLDNCEHVLDGAAEMAEACALHCPEVAVLATSREPLAVEGEQILRLRGLGSEDISLELFVNRATSADADFAPATDEVERIKRICEELDHLPLAIELAAARAPSVGFDSLIDTLHLGASNRRDRRRLGRHRSLRDVVEWSAGLLSPAERTAFRRLAIFDGGFTAEAAQRVVACDGETTNNTDGLLSSLVDQSLLDVVRSNQGLRYRMLETIRAQALHELDASGEADEIRDRHLQWVREWSAETDQSTHSRWWFPSTAELANQRAALRYAFDAGKLHDLAELLPTMTVRLCVAGAEDEAIALLDRFDRAAADRTDPRITGRRDLAAMLLPEMAGDFERSHRLGQLLRESTSDDHEWFLATLLLAHHQAGVDPAGSDRLLDELDARFGASPMSVHVRGEASISRGEYTDAIDLILSALGADSIASLPSPTPDAPLDTSMVTDLTVALILSARRSEALSVIDTLGESIDDENHAYAAVVPLLRAVAHATDEDRAATIAHLREARHLEQQWPEVIMTHDCVAAACLVALEWGHPELAARAYAAIHGGPTRAVSTFAWRTLINRSIREELSNEDRTSLIDAGRTVSPETAFNELVDALDTLSTLPS